MHRDQLYLICSHTSIVFDIFPRSQKTGYFGDLSRTVVRGRASERLKEIYATVQAGQKIGFDLIRNGINGHEIHQKILDLFESLTGARMMCNYMRFGGCRVDLPEGWLEQAKRVVAEFPRFVDEFENLISGNEILMARTQGVGVLNKQLAVNASITGPMLRATGVNYDIRKVDKYGIYDRFEFRVPLGEHGDVFDRYMIRVLEMRESLKILNRALQDIPEGPIIDIEVTRWTSWSYTAE